MSDIILKAENISKQYRLGTVGTGTLRDDFKRNWAKLRGKEDPFLKVGTVNDRSQKSTEDYVWALHDINFEVKQGEVLGIIGKNGAGKSTLLKILSRVTAPTSGVIKSRGRIASLLEVGTGFHPELTGRENIYLNGAILGMTKAEINSKLDEIIDFSGCERYIDTPTKRYSSGMTVRLAFAVAAHLEPEILVVDEVLAVGDAEFQKKAIGKMQDISQEEGRTVLFVSHNMASVQNLCTSVILLENGLMKFNGETSDIIELYLSSAKLVVEKMVELNKSHRRLELSQEIKMKTIECLTIEPTTRYPLNFEIKLEYLTTKISEISVTGSISTLSGKRLGSFFSKEIKLSKNTPLIFLSIQNHNLSPGNYYVNFSIASGTLENDNLKQIDHAYEAIYFQISKEYLQGRHITEWRSSWGDAFYECNLDSYAEQF